MSASDVLKFIKDKEAEFVDLRFTDPRGKTSTFTMDVTAVDEEMLKMVYFLMVLQLLGGKLSMNLT